jgi:peptide/nickel transport system ATP-binding protein/glutathione transport system ATP-binding protein
MIFQEPMTSLNPVFTIGRQLMEGLRLHMGLSNIPMNCPAVCAKGWSSPWHSPASHGS